MSWRSVCCLYCIFIVLYIILLLNIGLYCIVGRGAPEIDIMEAMPGRKELYVTPVSVPYFSSSFQVSPALEDRPFSGADPAPGTWYHTHDIGNEVGLTYGPNTSENVFFYGTYFDRKDGQLDRGYQADAISG